MGSLVGWTAEAFGALRHNLHWMGWNLFLAVVPLALSVWLFRPHRPRTFFWWLVACIWLAFLPNAPYVLTDIIHLIDETRDGHYSAWVIGLVLIPEYIVFILSGFLAYVVSLIYLGRYLKSLQLKRWVLPVELTLHALSAMGVYLGRFVRLNSWDIVTGLRGVVAELLEVLAAKQPLLVIAITFAIITTLYYALKVICLALYSYWQRSDLDVPGLTARTEK